MRWPEPHRPVSLQLNLKSAVVLLTTTCVLLACFQVSPFVFTVAWLLSGCLAFNFGLRVEESRQFPFVLLGFWCLFGVPGLIGLIGYMSEFR